VILWFTVALYVVSLVARAALKVGRALLLGRTGRGPHWPRHRWRMRR
jgi:hypothetical protein